MMDQARQELFDEKYKDAEQIWSGSSLINYADLKTLMAELPISQVAAASRSYPHRRTGNLDYVFGELTYDVLLYEGFLRDKTCYIKEVLVKPVFQPNTTSLEIDIQAKSKTGEMVSRSFEVVRHGERSYILFTERYRPG